MAWGLEARVPFLDHEFVELAAAIPPSMKLTDGGKGVMKRASRGIVPDAVIDRSKGSFPVPAIRQLEGPYLERVRDALHAPEARGARALRPRHRRADAAGPEQHQDRDRRERALAARPDRDVAAAAGGAVTVGAVRTGGAQGVASSATVEPSVTTRAAADLGAQLTAAWGSWGPTMIRNARRVAFVSDRHGTPEVFVQDVVVDGELPEPVRIALSDDPVIRVSWSSDGEWLAVAIATDGGVKQQVWVVRPDGTDARADRRLAVPARRTRAVEPQRAPGRHHPALDRARAAGPCVPGRPGHRGPRRPGRGGAHPHPRPVGGGTARRAERRAARPGVRRGRRPADRREPRPVRRRPRRVRRDRVPPALARERDQPARRLRRHRGRTAPPRTRRAAGRGRTAGAAHPRRIVERDDAELEYLDADDAGRTVLLVWNVDGRSELDLINTHDASRTPVPDLPGYVVTDPVLSRDGRSVLLAIEGPTRPRELWRLDTNALTWSRVTDVPALPDVQLVEPTLERFTARDGLELTGWLYRAVEPATSSAVGARAAAAVPPGPRAALVHLHGGPESQERPTFSPQHQALAAAGVTVFAPNIRGSSGYGHEFVHADDLALRWNALADVVDCARFLVTNGYADRSRVAVEGRSCTAGTRPWRPWRSRPTCSRPGSRCAG
ncbi:asparagine synthase-related protein [Curtobacterium flaccumfaciens]|nr:asparagine synthase-related protein [Curtobacterium flaccumfaciens]